jgi:hypothetical protein
VTNRPQIRAPYSTEYIEALKFAVKLLGRNVAATAVGRDATTIHRNINEGKLTYAMALDLVDAINDAGLVDDNKKPVTMPPPFVPVIDWPHYRFCELYDRLARFPKVLDGVLKKALEDLHEAETEEMLGDVHDKLRSPK